MCGHGSRSPSAIAEFAELARAIEVGSGGYKAFAHGFLEFARPTLSEALDSLRARGVKAVDAIPGMLLAAGHAKNDIPALLRNYELGHGIEIRYGRPLGLDARMLAAAARRVREALGGEVEGFQSRYHETLLVVVGRGSSDPDANSEVSKLTRLLWETLGFGWAITAYSGVTFPLVAPALELAVRLGYRRILLFPYFLFSGILIDRIYAALDAAVERWREVEFVKARYLDCQDDVVETFLARAAEIEAGDGAMMNCALCKYRELVVGFEQEQGAAQASHHHHVEGIGVGQNGDAQAPDSASDHASAYATAGAHGHSHGHSHGNGHGHGHSHAPYPHAKHPLGPITLQTTKQVTKRVTKLVTKQVTKQVTKRLSELEATKPAKD